MNNAEVMEYLNTELNVCVEMRSTRQYYLVKGMVEMAWRLSAINDQEYKDLLFCLSFTPVSFSDNEPHWLSDEEIEIRLKNSQPIVGSTFENTLSSDPVIVCDNQFYYWNETWSECCGPFENEEDCRASLAEYAKTI